MVCFWLWLGLMASVGTASSDYFCSVDFLVSR